MKIAIIITLLTLATPAFAAEAPATPDHNTIVICRPGNWCRIICPPANERKEWWKLIHELKIRAAFQSPKTYHLKPKGKSRRMTLKKAENINLAKTLSREHILKFITDHLKELGPGC